MKKLFLIFALTVTTAPAFAQYHYSCQVVMIDRYHRVIQRFFSQRDYRTGQCRAALRRCHHEIRRRHIYGARCAQVRR